MFKNPFRKKDLYKRNAELLDVVRKNGDKKAELALLLIQVADESTKMAKSLDQIYDIFQGSIDEFPEDVLFQFPVNMRVEIDRLRDCCDQAYEGVNNLNRTSINLVKELPSVVNKKI